jgi:phage/plasmid-like protein (TIGR03299 family)
MLAFYKSLPTNNSQTLNNPRGFGPIFKGKIMAHLIETNTITGKSEIAYVAQKPWHGLGQQLTPDAPIDVWRKEAGLDWEAQVSPVMFWPEGIAAPQVVENKNVIFRNDTKTPLGVVSDRYKIHQPADVLDFFNTLVQSAGFSLEVAGAIRGGKRIWALANVNKESVVLHDDAVKGYLLLSTSFDGSAATIGQFTSIRVVCNNTLSAADSEESSSRVMLTHGTDFDSSLMRERLGIIVGGFDGMMDKYRSFARQDVSSAYAKEFFNKLFPATFDPETQKLKESRGFKRVTDLFDGAGMGSNFPGVYGTRWGLLNAVTQYIDHERGHNVDSRMNNAWFGNGNRLKTEAESLLLA